ncbi:UNVERIFIED_ORG: hypothetical protein ABIB13_002912 [Arthrobacter sp. UYEF2]
MMIPQPDWTCSAEVQDGIAKAETKNVPGLDLLRLETIDEGLSVQILHIGRYDDEAPTLSCLHHEYIPATAPDLPARTTRSTSAMPAGWQRKSSKPSFANPGGGSETFSADVHVLLLARRRNHWLGSAVWLN